MSRGEAKIGRSTLAPPNSGLQGLSEAQTWLCGGEFSALLAVRADQLHLDFIGGWEAFEQLAEVDGRQRLRLAAGQHVAGVDIAVLGAMLFVVFFVFFVFFVV